MDEKTLSIANLEDGAAIQLIDEELQKIWSNVQDPETDPEKKREVTLKITFAPNEERDDIKAEIQVTSKLAPPRPSTSRILLGHEDGALVAAEWKNPQTDLENYIDNNVVKMNGGEK